MGSSCMWDFPIYVHYMHAVLEFKTKVKASCPRCIFPFCLFARFSFHLRSILSFFTSYPSTCSRSLWHFSFFFFFYTNFTRRTFLSYPLYAFESEMLYQKVLTRTGIKDPVQYALVSFNTKHRWKFFTLQTLILTPLILDMCNNCSNWRTISIEHFSLDKTSQQNDSHELKRNETKRNEKKWEEMKSH